MKITKLSSNNILRLEAVEIEPDGSLVIVGGMNEAGKTSVLDSILLAMGGRSAKHKRPLKDGTEKGSIEIELDDLLIKRTYTKKGTALKVTTKDGAASYSSPQKMLDKLTGSLTFDPLAWCDMDTKKQLDVLKALVGLDFTVMDEKRKALYDERTDVNRKFKDETAHFEAMPGYEDAPDEEVSVTDLIAEMDKRRRINEKNQIERDSVQEWEDAITEGQKKEKEISKSISKYIDDIEALKDIVESLKSRRKETFETINECFARKNEQQTRVANLVDANEKEVMEEIQGAEEFNNQVRGKRVKADVDALIKSLAIKGGDLSKKVLEYDEEKKRQLAAAEFPIDGLSFNEDGVLFNGIPFEQSSSAQKLRVSVAMGLALNPDLKVLLIRDGSLLDENNLKLISDMVEEAGAQIWIERVGKGEECTVVIEDGKVLNEA